MSKTISQSPIAVVGMACRLPARTPDEFWRILLEGASAIGPVPDSRLNRRFYYNPQKGLAGTTYADKAALVDYTQDLTPDALFTEREIRDHDMAHITFCRVAGEALGDARWSAAPGSRTGVYVGHATGSGEAGRFSYGVHGVQMVDLLHGVEGFDRLPQSVREGVIAEAEQAIRNSAPRRTTDRNPDFEANQAARLTAEKFGFDGPAMVFNSACASSLQAMAHGMKSLALGRIDTAVVGGASCFNSDTLVLFSQAQSLSAEGSHPFTEGADGLIVGEGFIAFVLKRLASAVAAGDRVLAVLPGVGIASDGRGKSLWAPRSEGQIKAIQRAYADPSRLADIQYIEAHATSTNLGDKTEIESLTCVLSDRLGPGVKIPIGSVKRNIGHTLEVAGAAGLLKVILAIRHRTIPPAVDGSRRLTSEVDWSNSPVFVNDQPIEWPTRGVAGPLRAAVNAFGIGGLNVHLMVESYEGQPSTTPASSVEIRRPAVAIVGVGVVLPGAHDVSAFKGLLQSGATACGDFPADRWDPRRFDDPQRLGDRSISLPAAGAVTDWEYDWRKHRIPPKQLAQANPLQFMMLDAVDQAFKQSGLLESDRFDRRRTGVLVGTQFGGDFATQLLMGLRLPPTRETLAQALARRGVASDDAAALLEAWSARVLERFPALVDESGSFTASALASRITKSFDLMGGGIAVDAANLGSFAALEGAVDTLSTGACDTMVCVAGEHSLVPESYLISALSGRLASGVVRGRPFDEGSDGVVPGVGCVALILKRLDEARAEGCAVLGVIDGIGFARDTDRGAAIERAALRALEESALERSSIRAIESSGCGAPALDTQESLQTARAYNRPSPLPTRSPSGQFGHLGSGAGLVSVIAALSAMDAQSLPANPPGYQPIEPLRDLKGSPPGQPHPLTSSDPRGRLGIGIVGATPFDTSYHVILQRGAL